MKTDKKYWKLGRRELKTEIFDIDTDGSLLVREGNYQYRIMDLINHYKTPLEIVFPFMIEKSLLELTDTFNNCIKQAGYSGKFFYHYPMKVNQNKEFVLPIVSEGGNLEVASVNELWLVKKLWEKGRFNPNLRVICNGPKAEPYLELIRELKAKGLQIIPVIEDRAEMKHLLSPEGRVNGPLGIRVDVDLKIKSRWDKKINRYGLTPAEILEIGRIPRLKLLHYHIGSQVENIDDLVRLVREAMKLYSQVKINNPNLDIIDIGGGFPANYEKKVSYPYSGVVKNIVNVVKEMSDRSGQPAPDIVVEWGRFLVAPAQITIFKVLHTKKIDNAVAKKWYVVDGSFINDLSDTWAIHQKWHITPVNNMLDRKLDPVWLAGSSCDSDDKYTAGGSYILLPEIDSTDEQPQYIAVYDTGAYQDSLSSHHCLLSSPAKIIVQNGDITVARRRETSEEIGRLFGW